MTTNIQSRCHEAIGLVASGQVTPLDVHAALLENFVHNAAERVYAGWENAAGRLAKDAETGKMGTFRDKAAAYGGVATSGAGALGAAGAALGGGVGAVHGIVQRIRGKENASIARSLGKGVLWGGGAGAAVGAGVGGAAARGVHKELARRGKADTDATRERLSTALSQAPEATP